VPKMPTVPYIWNDTHVDIMLENASEDPTVIEKNITGFFRGIGVERLSSGNIIRLINAGFGSVPEIIAMSEEDFLNIGGFKDKMANKIYTGIQEKLNEASIITLMAASNIFGRGFSEKRMELVLAEIPNILTSQDSVQDKIEQVSLIKGMATKTAEAFVCKIDEFKEFLSKCGLEYKLQMSKFGNGKEENLQNLHTLTGKTIVLSGTRDKTIIEFLKEINANNGSNISKNTFLVVAKDISDETGKIKEAKKLNIPIMSVSHFIDTYMKN
jgi:NAD-dependent DNA ligase